MSPAFFDKLARSGSSSTSSLKKPSLRNPTGGGPGNCLEILATGSFQIDLATRFYMGTTTSAEIGK